MSKKPAPPAAAEPAASPGSELPLPTSGGTFERLKDGSLKPIGTQTASDPPLKET